MLRGTGAVGCAHCKMIGADRACAVCTRLVCETCAADWATCDEPYGRVVRLGLTARVRDVDPTGRLALVSHWRKPLRLFDLRQLRWVHGIELPRSMWLWSRAAPPRLTSDDRVVYAEFTMAGTGERATTFDGIFSRSLHTGESVLVTSGEYPGRGTGVSATGDRFWYVTDSQRVAVITPPPTTTSPDSSRIVALHGGRGPRADVVMYEPLPRKVVHAAHVDGERDLLAVGSWSEIVLHRMIDGRLERLDHAKTDAPGDVRWIAVAGPWLVAAVVNIGAVAQVEVRRIEPTMTIGPVVHLEAGLFQAASLSRDGRYLAIALQDRGLLVRELGTENVTLFTEHTDRINYVRFAGDDHVLISADTDNRVVLRPRTRSGYARPLLPVAIPEQTVELTAPRPS